MPVHDRVGAAQSEALALLPLGGEERIEDVQADLLGHADPGVDDLAVHSAALGPRPEGEVAPLRHRVERVEGDRSKNLAQLGHVTRRQRDRSQLGVDLAGDAPGRKLLCPARAGGRGDLLDELVEIHGLEGAGRAGATEILEAPDHPRALEGDLLDHAERAADVGVLDVREEELRPGENAGQRVVEVVRDLAGHLPERAKPLLLDHLEVRGDQTVQERAHLAHG